MDIEKCKLFTQGIEFLQKNLHLDDSLLKNLCRCEIITPEQAKNITVSMERLKIFNVDIILFYMNI